MHSLLVTALSALILQGAGLVDVPEVFPDSLSYILDSSSVFVTRLSEHVPVAFTVVDADELRGARPSSSLPQVLALQPSVVSVAEGGTGVGYTSLSVRGVPGTHTNVTLNGISLADNESQQVFWVNIPALSSILDMVQIQRGLGTAACGPGAFGASINMETADPSGCGGYASGSYGSFGTWTATARGYGRASGGFYADAAFNHAHTDGCIRNAPADVWSAYGNFGWQGRRDRVHLVLLHGQQRSAITWNGVPFDVYPSDPRFNSNPGDTDNFRQTHVQGHYSHAFSDSLTLSAVLNYTRGYGWYDIAGNCDYLKNDLYVLRSDIVWRKDALTMTGQAYFSHFNGLHWGAGYADAGVKSEMDVSARAEWTVVRPLTLFGEVQYRGVRYDLHDVLHTWNFCNPRLGVNWSPGSDHKLYAFFAAGHREPARADFEADASALHETLYDTEIGYRFSSSVFGGSVNLYSMEYRNMLLETGRLDSQGYAIKENIPGAYRRGVEVSMALRPWEWVSFDASCTWSVNRISESSSDDVKAGNSLLLSPSWIASASLSLTPWKGFRASLDGKYVGLQYYNNTGLDVSGRVPSAVPEYFVLDLSASQRFLFRHTALSVTFNMSNLADRRYYAYAYDYGVYPAAPRSWTVGLRLEVL